MAYTKDQRIINENTTLTAYELLTQKGLSQEKYNELVTANYQPKIKPQVPEQPVKPPQPIQPTVTRAQPKLSRPTPQQAPKNHMAYLVNKKTGKRTRMTRASAEFAARLDKNFKVQ